MSGVGQGKELLFGNSDSEQLPFKKLNPSLRGKKEGTDKTSCKVPTPADTEDHSNQGHWQKTQERGGEKARNKDVNEESNEANME